MSGIHRSHSGSRRAKKSGNGRLAVAAIVAGVLGMGAVALGIVALRPDDGGTGGTTAGDGQSGLRVPRSGPAVKLTTPEGYGYSLAAVGRGTTARPGSGAAAAPAGAPGAKLAYADYVLTNTERQAVLLDFPADLFVRRSKAQAEGLARCMPQPGADSDMCTLPNKSKIIGYLHGSKRPTVEQGGDRFIPPGSSYLVRLTTELPVKADTQSTDIKLYVWNVRYILDRKAVEIVFP